MPFGNVRNITPNRKRTDRNTWPLSSVRAPRRRRQPVPPDNLPVLLESDSDAEEIPDNLPEVPKASRGKSRIDIANYYTDVLEVPPQREWKGHGGTILIIREELRVPVGVSKNHPEGPPCSGLVRQEGTRYNGD